MNGAVAAPLPSVTMLVIAYRMAPTIETHMTDSFFDDAEAHTVAKHRILQEYLKGWLPILGQGQTNRLLYFDGFAGCGDLSAKAPPYGFEAAETSSSPSGEPFLK